MRRPIRCLPILILAAIGPIFAIALVSAHAGYERSTPARNEVVSDAPARVNVWFTQELFRRQGDNFVRVFDEDDVQVSEGDGVIDDDDRTHIYAELPPAIPDGSYIVRWMTLSDIDGESDDGAFCFYIGEKPTDAQEAACAALADRNGHPAPPPPAATPTEAEDAPMATLTAPEAMATPTAVVDDGDSTNTGIIVGVVIGGIVVAMIAIGVVVWMRRTPA